MEFGLTCDGFHANFQQLIVVTFI